ncbi:unnamed protein product [Closterium sp. Naga37s-1]|nr:unnamed protein product [Closterium sp. Naga37s-1]
MLLLICAVSNEVTTFEEEEVEAEEDDEIGERPDEKGECQEKEVEEVGGKEDDEEEDEEEGEEAEEEGGDGGGREGCGRADVEAGDSDGTRIPTPSSFVEPADFLPDGTISALGDYERGEKEEEEAEEEEKEEEEDEVVVKAQEEDEEGEEGGAEEAGANQSPFSFLLPPPVHICNGPSHQQGTAARTENTKQETLEGLVFQLGLMGVLGLVKRLVKPKEQLLASWGLNQADVDAWVEELVQRRKDRGEGSGGLEDQGGMVLGGSGGGVVGDGGGVGGGDANAAVGISAEKHKFGNTCVGAGDQSGLQ